MPTLVRANRPPPLPPPPPPSVKPARLDESPSQSTASPAHSLSLSSLAHDMDETCLSPARAGPAIDSEGTGRQRAGSVQGLQRAGNMRLLSTSTQLTIVFPFFTLGRMQPLRTRACWSAASSRRIAFRNRPKNSARSVVSSTTQQFDLPSEESVAVTLPVLTSGHECKLCTFLRESCPSAFSTGNAL